MVFVARTRPSASLVRQGLPLLVVAVLLFTTASCSSSPGAPAPTATPTSTLTPAVPHERSTTVATAATPAARATPPVFTSSQAVLGQVIWAAAVDPTTNAPREPVQVFAHDVETIYAVIPVIRLEADMVVSAAWTYNDTPVEPLTSRVTASATYTDGWMEFHISRSPDEPWPTGTYRVTVLVGEEEALSADVQVHETP